MAIFNGFYNALKCIYIYLNKNVKLIISIITKLCLIEKNIIYFRNKKM